MTDYFLILFAFTLFVLATIAMISMFILPFFFLFKFNIRKQKKFEAWVAENNYTFIGESVEPFENFKPTDFFFNNKTSRKFSQVGRNSVYSTVSLLRNSSYSYGGFSKGFRGVLPESKNSFMTIMQTETRGSGKNSATFRRTIFKIDVPDTKLHLIINSKVNNDINSGDNITNYTNDQRYSLEGVFGEYFEVYMPESTQAETLSILAPDTMQFILTNLNHYDIEVSGKSLYLYTYTHLSTDKIEAVLRDIDTLLKEARLRKNDSKYVAASTVVVSRRVDSETRETRTLKKFNKARITIILVSLIGLFLALNAFLDSSWASSAVYVLMFAAFLLTFGRFIVEPYRRWRFERSLKNFNKDKLN